jgi:hypothetical protein
MNITESLAEYLATQRAIARQAAKPPGQGDDRLREEQSKTIERIAEEITARHRARASSYIDESRWHDTTIVTWDSTTASAANLGGATTLRPTTGESAAFSRAFAAGIPSGWGDV